MEEDNCFSVSGVKVHFPPFKPFPVQVALMNKVLKAVQNEDNALLESPTGTGETWPCRVASHYELR